MPKKVSDRELGAIREAVSDFPDGASIAEIRQKLPFELPSRTLQRRLKFLVEQKKLAAEGSGKGRRYRLPKNLIISAHPARLELKAMPSSVETYPPLSSEARQIKEQVRASIQERQPVGYQRTFLEIYAPNESYYLSPELREHLLSIGQPPGGDRPAGTYARTIYNRLLIDLSWNSSRLEGNTYSLLETQRLIEVGEAAYGKAAVETQMILNHKAAIELLVDQADEIGFNAYTVLNLHALLADNLLADPEAGGRLRQIPVGVGGTVYHPLEVPQLISECFDVILAKAAAIEDPFEQAFFALVHLAYLQGFEDVNKRVSRLAANIPLIRMNLCPLSFVDVPEQAYIDGILGIYELNRIELLRDVFVWAYERSSARYSAVRQSLGEPDPFRLRYRTLVAELVSQVVRSKLDKAKATALVRQRASKEIPEEDRQRFIEITETELISLHEGNIARYRLRPSEYQDWRKDWR